MSTTMSFRCVALLSLCCAALAQAVHGQSAPEQQRWRPDHVVIVVLENQTGMNIVGNLREMPYLNALAAAGAVMTNAYFAQTPYTGDSPAGLPARPSQPNYLYLVSGNNQGVLPEWRGGIHNGLVPPAWRPFTTPNLGAALIAAGLRFASFSESLPYPHYDGERDINPRAERYRRKHNPIVNWLNLTRASVPPNKARFVLPVDANLGFANTLDAVDGKRYRGFAVDETGAAIGYDQLPAIALVIPNEQHNAHSASNAACDKWLRQHIGPYADWARSHNSLLIVTYDEDGSTNATRGDAYETGIDRIATFFYGPQKHVHRGQYDEHIDHLNVLATVLDRYGLLAQFRRDFAQAHRGAEATAQLRNLRAITDVFGEGPALPALAH